MKDVSTETELSKEKNEEEDMKSNDNMVRLEAAVDHYFYTKSLQH